MRPSESQFKTILIRSLLQSQFVEDVSSETVVLVEYRSPLGATLGPLRGLLGPFGGLLAPPWTVMRPPENEFKTNFIQIPLRSQFMEDVSSETAVLVEYWKLLGAILGPFRGLLGPFGGFLGSSWTVQSPPRAKPRRS